LRCQKAKYSSKVQQLLAGTSATKGVPGSPGGGMSRNTCF